MLDVAEPRTPNPVDLHVGARVRMRRRILGVSQEKLAEQLGLTFQQVQKYERGANRVSASKLYEIARALSTSVSYFFEGLADTASPPVEGVSESGTEQFVHEFLMTPEGVELASSFARIRQGKVRRKILDLVRALSDGPVPEGEGSAGDSSP